jgi:hypothetical protein
MKSMLRLAVGVCAVAGFAVAAEARCTRTSAVGEGLTPEIAKEMAKINLDFTVSSKGAKASGPVAFKCGAPGMLLLTSCTAKQRTCS